MLSYHIRVGFPPSLRLPIGTFALVYHDHAKRAAERRGIQTLLPATLDTARAEAVEVETLPNGAIKKVLYRISLDDFRDLCLAVTFDEYPLRVKTVYVNKRHDRLCATDLRRYVNPFSKRV
jgi:hypothetical protein